MAARLNEQQEAHWRGLASGTPDKQRWQDAVTIARKHGVDYLPPVEAAQRKIEEVLARIETLNVGDRKTDVAVVDAVLGAVEKPKVMLSDLIKEYEAASKTDMAAMSVNQLRKWRNGKKAAVDKFIEVRTDKALSDLSRADFTEYADHWEARVISGEINAGTANKSISHVTGMVRAVNKRLRLGLDPSIFTETRLEGGRDGNRSPFTVEHIRNVILAPGALDGLNDEARDVVYVVMETGCRPSEIVNLSQGADQVGLRDPVHSRGSRRQAVKDRAQRARHPARRLGLGSDEAAPGGLSALPRQRRQSIGHADEALQKGQTAAQGER